jgi:hypothetical protein
MWSRKYFLIGLSLSVIFVGGLALFLRSQNNVIENLREEMNSVKANLQEAKPILDYLVESTEPKPLPAAPVADIFYQENLPTYNIPVGDDHPYSGHFVGLHPGQGFRAIDEMVAIRVSNNFPFPSAISNDKTPIKRSTPATTSTESITDVNEAYEAKMLYTAFAAKLSGWGATVDLSASMKKAREELSQNTIIYITVSTKGNDSVTVDDRLCKWDDPAVEQALSRMEKIDDDDERRDQFVRHFGTHYIKTVEYGSKIIIRVSMANKEKKAVDELKAAIAIAGWGQSGSAEVEEKVKTAFRQYQCSLEIKTLGSLDPRNAFIMDADIMKIYEVLAKIRSGEIKFSEVPVSFTLASYENTIDGDKYPKIKRMFQKREPSPVLLTGDAYLNVPAGTVLAFAGTDVPTGYFLCNGDILDSRQYGRLFKIIGTKYGKDPLRQNSFKLPDYRGYFLRGADLGSGHDPDAVTRLPLGDGKPDSVGSVQQDEFKEHVHDQDVDIQIPNSLGNNWKSGHRSGRSGPHNVLNKAPQHDHGPKGGAETRPKNISVKYIIKY